MAPASEWLHEPAEIALAAHDLADAREAADELPGIARTFDQPVLHAVAHQALGASLTYEEDAAAAITELRRAVRHWTEADAPFEAAQAARATLRDASSGSLCLSSYEARSRA